MADRVPLHRISPGVRRLFRAGLVTAALCIATMFSASGAVVLNPPLPAGEGIRGFSLAADRTNLVFQADYDRNGAVEFYRVPITGAASQLLLTAVAGTNTAWCGLAPTPGGERVIYCTGPSGSFSLAGLYSEPVGGGMKIRLNDPLPAGGTIDFVELSPDGQWVVYISDQRINDRIEIFSVPSGGGTVAVLNGPMHSNGDVRPLTGGTTWNISPDSTRVVYRADQDADGVDEIYSAPIGGGGATKLNPPLVLGGDTLDFLISSDSVRVIYTADQEVNGRIEIYSVLVAGGTAVKLNGAIAGGGTGVQQYASAQGYAISPDSVRVVYRADQHTAGVIELYSAPIDGSSPAQRLNTALAPGRSVTGFKISPDSAFVVFTADQDTDNAFELFRVPIAGGTMPVKLNRTSVPPPSITAYQIAPDNSRVAYSANQDNPAKIELYSVAAAGGDPVRINLPFAGTEVIGYFGNMFAITPDSRNVIHLTSANDFPLEPLKIFAASLCCGPVVRLDPVTPVGGGSASITYTFSADGRYIIYLADPDQDGFNELYRSDIPDFTTATAPHIAQYVVNHSGPSEFRWLPLTNRVWIEHRSRLETNDTWETIAGPITNSACWTGALPGGPSGFVRVRLE